MKRYISILILICLALIITALTLNQSEPLSPQSRGNIIFAANPSLVSALNHYNPVSPPLYLTLMWLLSQASLPLVTLNLLAFLGTICWLWFAPSWLPSWKRIVLIGIYTLRPCVAANLHQYVAESLLILIAMLTLSLLLSYLKAPRLRTLALLALLVGLACMTRYFAIFWLVPIAGSAILWQYRKSIRTLVLHGSTFAIIVSACCLPWLFHAKTVSGFWFGMSRTAARSFPPQYAYFSDTITPAANLLLMLRTLTIDLFSPVRFANHDLAAFGPLSALELLIPLVAVLLLLGSRLPVQTSIGTKLSALMAGWFLIATFVVWSSGNNDPIYTRFLYPCYLFIGISAASLRISVQSFARYYQAIASYPDRAGVRRREADRSAHILDNH